MDYCTLKVGDLTTVLLSFSPDSMDTCVTDPPYELNFMGKSWDRSGVSFRVDTWEAVYRVLKPGAHLLAFGGTRTVHRMTCAIEDAGFEIRDQLVWLHGQGFPKSLDVSKAIDKAAGAEREILGDRVRLGDNKAYPHNSNSQIYGKDNDRIHNGMRPPNTAPATDAAREWAGWGTTLKPGHEPIIVARKPFAGTVASNVLQHGTGALNIDGCRIAGDMSGASFGGTEVTGYATKEHAGGRWPANVVLDDEAAAMLDAQSGERSSGGPSTKPSGHYDRGGGDSWMNTRTAEGGIVAYLDSGGASRFFYTAKASSSEREIGLSERNTHPTVKPIALMNWLVKLVMPPGGLVLDPFMGTGTTGIAVVSQDGNFVGIDIDPKSVELARRRILGGMRAAAK